MDLAAVADELAIRRLLAEYCQRLDDGRFDDVIELFAVDGEFSFGRLGATGRDGLRAWYRELQPPELRGKHLTTNSVVDVDGDRASVTSDFVFLAIEEGQLRPSVAGRYVDELVRVDGRWVIARREAVPLRGPRS